MARPRFSVIVPVYNRPQEVEELLQSLTRQTYPSFEVLLVEDGSTVTSRSVFERYATQLNLHYFFKPNSGPGPSRNFGFERATGDYLVVFDSDCVIPSRYFETVVHHLQHEPLDAWGGPDRGHADFTLLQQAMAYTMSATLTTGGIRGGKQHLGAFQPRSFNMGMSRAVYQETGGFRFDRFAEDIELSIRIRKLGFRVGLIPEAYVYHKRRTTWQQFFRQVSNFGKGRVLVGRAHPGELKLTHWFPSLFLVGLATVPLLLIGWFLLGLLAAGAYAVYFALLFISALWSTRSAAVALLAIPAALVQLGGYGFGFLKELLKTYIQPS